MTSATMEAQPTDKVCPVCSTRYDAQAVFCQREGAILVSPGAELDPYLGRTLFEQFRLDAVLGRGGMGTVYKARQLAMGRDVAVKILHRSLVQNPEAVRRFQREVRLATALDHPNLVRVFLFGQLPDGSLYLVMEYLDGRPLTMALMETPVFEVPRALHVLHQIAGGLSVAHGRGVVHRDIKPENLLLVTEDGDPDFVKVLDFGIARSMWGEQTNLTQSGVIFGTARYISPEGASGEPTDTRSDVYSVGVLAYQLLCGETPFDAPSPVALLMKHVHAKAPDIRGRARGGKVPAPIAELVMKCLAKKPDARPADAGALAEALRIAAAAAGIPLVPPEAPLSTTTSGIHEAPQPAPMVSAARRDPTPVHASSPSQPLAPVYPSTPSPASTSQGNLTPVVGRGDPSTASRISRPSSAGRISVSGLPVVHFDDDAASDVDEPIAAAPVRSRRPWAIAALVLTIVGGVAVAIAMRGPRAPTDAELLDQAKRAFDAGRYDGPAEDDVASLTDRVLTRASGNERALEIRRASADRLRLSAIAARRANDLDQATALLERASVLDPENASIRMLIVEIESQRTRAAIQPGIRIDPSLPAINQPFSVHVNTGARVEALRVVVTRGRKTVKTLDVHAADGTNFVAEVTVTAAGTYDVVASAGPVVFRTSVEVSATRRYEPPPITTQGSVPVYTPLPPGTNAPTMAAEGTGTAGPTYGNVPVTSAPTQAPLITRTTPTPEVTPTPTPDPPAPTPTPPTPPPPWTGGD